MEHMLMMVAMLLSTDVHDKKCWELDKIASGYITHRHAEHLREITPDKVTFFNAKEPTTDWTNVWLMDLPKGAGVVLAGYDDWVCSVGIFPPHVFIKTIEELEGGRS